MILSMPELLDLRRGLGGDDLVFGDDHLVGDRVDDRVDGRPGR
jgi:hypothetical protein